MGNESFREEVAKRYRIKRRSGNLYLTISDRAIMAHAANESAPYNAGEYSLVNAVCRLASKWRGAGGDWLDIARQIEAGGVGFNTLNQAIADVIKEHIKGDIC